MRSLDPHINLEQALSEIPAEYQDIFRRAINEELAEAGQNKTDTEILSYLRERRQDIQRGSFIRPDGEPGMLTLPPEMIYEKALPALARESKSAEGDQARRQLLLKLGLLAIGLLLLGLFVARGRSPQAETVIESVTTATPVGDATDPALSPPTPSLPTLLAAEDALQTIGTLGGALTIGRPSSIELSYLRSQETIALAIDPSQPTPKGEMRYNESVMNSDNPVAVWLFGTILNYAIGLPESMVRNLAVGDRISLNTDTGTALPFVVTETGEGASYDAGRLLSQDRLGVTLFALPAASETAVAYVRASYDLSWMGNDLPPVYTQNEAIDIRADGQLRLESVDFAAAGLADDVRIAVSGWLTTTPATTGLLTLRAGAYQTTAVPLVPDSQGRWSMIATLPDDAVGTPLMADFRSLPGETVFTLSLGEVPRLLDQLEVTIDQAVWDENQVQAILSLSVHNPGPGAIQLPPEFIQLPIPTEGGDEHDLTWQLVPPLPQLINPGETMGVQLSFFPQALSVQVKIDNDLWILSGFPADGLDP